MISKAVVATPSIARVLPSRTKHAHLSRVQDHASKAASDHVSLARLRHTHKSHQITQLVTLLTNRPCQEGSFPQILSSTRSHFDRLRGGPVLTGGAGANLEIDSITANKYQIAKRLSWLSKAMVILLGSFQHPASAEAELERSSEDQTLLGSLGPTVRCQAQVPTVRRVGAIFTPSPEPRQVMQK